MFTKHHSHHNSYTDGSHLQPCQYQQQIPYLKQQMIQQQQQQQIPFTLQQQQQQQQQQQIQRQPQQSQQPKKQKTNILNIYKEGKQKIIMSFYNLYRNYPTEPPSFTSSPIWMLGKCYEVSNNNSNHISNTNNYNSNNISPNYINNNSNNNSLKTSLFQSLFNNNSNNINTNSNTYINNNSNNNIIANNNSSNENQYNHNNCITNSSFLDDISSLIWFSYRKDFPPIDQTNITTDIGWGCMLRTGQMILARALLKHSYPDNYIINEQERNRSNSKYNQVLKLFSDYQSKEHLYGIHQIVHMKKAMERKIRQQALESYNRRKLLQQKQQQQQQHQYNGIKVKIESDSDSSSDSEDEWDNVEEWLAPTKISNVLRQLVKNQNISDLEMYVPNDGVIYREYINQLCNPYYYNNYKNSDNGSNNNNINIQPNNSYKNNNIDNLALNQSPPSRVPSEVFNHPLSNNNEQDYYELNKWKSLIIMIPLKLGVDRINVTYVQKLKTILTIPQSLGFIGGKPKQSFYFVGFQDDQVIYLDPHFVQDTVDPNTTNYSETFSDCIPQKMSFSNIDPSLSVGFYCKDKSSFDDLCSRLSQLENDHFPIITVSNKLPDYKLEVDLVEDFNEEVVNSDGLNSTATINQNFNNNIASLNPNMNNSIKFGSFDTDDEFQFVNNKLKSNNNNNNNSINSNKDALKQQSQLKKSKSSKSQQKEQFSAMYSHPPNFSSDDEIDDFTMIN